MMHKVTECNPVRIKRISKYYTEYKYDRTVADESRRFEVVKASQCYSHALSNTLCCGIGNRFYSLIILYSGALSELLRKESFVVLYALIITKQKYPVLRGYFTEFGNSYSWCSIKDDHRTSFGLDGVNVANMYTEIDENEDDE